MTPRLRKQNNPQMTQITQIDADMRDPETNAIIGAAEYKRLVLNLQTSAQSANKTERTR
jgi:hypothetical protein